MGAPDDEDPLAKLGRSPAEDAAFRERLPARISEELEEPPGRVATRGADDTTWLLRDGVAVASFDPGALDGLGPDDRRRAVTAFAQLVRDYDRLAPLIDMLAVGERVRVTTKNRQIRRTFRYIGEVTRVSAFEPGRGVEPGGWTFELEIRPRFAKPTRHVIDSRVLVDVRPA